MIDRKREGTELREEFSVLGSTGNVSARLFLATAALADWVPQVYTVVIDKKPSCNCALISALPLLPCVRMLK